MTVRVVDRTAYQDPRTFDSRPEGYDGIIAAIVYHHTGGTDSLNFLQTYHVGNPVSTHKLFAKDGTIYKLVPERKRAFHAGITSWLGRDDWNDFSLGYEIENKGDGIDPYTDEQYEAIAQSTAYDCANYMIPDRAVCDHKQIAQPPGRKIDPKGLDHERIKRRIREIRQSWPYAIPMWCCNDSNRG